MKEEMLNEIRKERNKIIYAIRKDNKKKKRLIELLNSPSVKEFLELSEMMFDGDLSIVVPRRDLIVGEILEKHMEFELDPEETNQIYLCTGKNYFCELRDGMYHLVCVKSPQSVRCGWYCNIESEIDNYLIPFEECDEFERNHCVIFHRDYEKIQSEFITRAVNSSQEKATKMILHKYKKQF